MVRCLFESRGSAEGKAGLESTQESSKKIGSDFLIACKISVHCSGLRPTFSLKRGREIDRNSY